MGSINREKLRIEGNRNTTGAILGFDIDAIAETISAPLLNVDGARTYLLSQEFVF